MPTGRRPSPQVTGISPKEGPPGTRVTIRGEHLGADARDLIGMLKQRLPTLDNQLVILLAFFITFCIHNMKRHFDSQKRIIYVFSY